MFQGLPMATVDRDPVELFGEWFATARQCGLYLPESVALATSTPQGIPSARMVLLKGFDAAGFTFYTNYGSRKASELDSNPNAALVFHWNLLQRQVRVQGTVTRTGAQESAAYFKTRPRGSRIAAWASRQSQTLPDRQALDVAYKQRQQEFGDGEIPLPEFWGGYRLKPLNIEFWQGRANRMHDRLLFCREGETWSTRWLYP